MSHSVGAMKLMMVMMMAMALLTTSHGIGIGIHMNTSSSSAPRCNGLTDTACRIAHSALDFDLEFMLDSEFNTRILEAAQQHPTQNAQDPTHPVSCDQLEHPNGCHGKPNTIPIQEHCAEGTYNRVCHHYPPH